MINLDHPLFIFLAIQILVLAVRETIITAIRHNTLEAVVNHAFLSPVGMVITMEKMEGQVFTSNHKRGIIHCSREPAARYQFVKVITRSGLNCLLTCEPSPMDRGDNV